MQLTDEQQACIDAYVNESHNMIVFARAGAAKTTTLKAMVRANPIQGTLCVAFNKSIATELNEDLPQGTSAKTLNSIGHGSWARTVSKRLVLDTRKISRIAYEVVKEPMFSGLQIRDLIPIVGAAKGNGYFSPVSTINPEHRPMRTKPFLDRDSFYRSLDVELEEDEKLFVDEVLFRSCREALKGTIDFNDQILMPVCFGGQFYHNPVIFIDEAQDLSPLNQRMLELMQAERYIAVGDDLQSIYGWRGADENSMHNIKDRWDMKEYKLTTSFRCGKRIVAEANWHAPDMRAWDESPDGEIFRHMSWDPLELFGEVAVICRNNAPLFRLAVHMFTNDVWPELAGNDILPQLERIMREFGRSTMSKKVVLHSIAEWEERTLRKSRNPTSVQDKANSMRALAESGNTLGEILNRIEHLANSTSRIKLTTGHRAKGLEWDTVYFLDEALIEHKRNKQEANLRYVIQTRAKKELHYATSKGYLPQVDEASEESL